MNCYGIALVALVAFVGTAYAGEELKAIKELYCSDDEAIRTKVTECLDALPEKVHQAKEICMEEAAPGVHDKEEFRKLACDETKDTAATMHACMDRLKAEHKDKITKEDMEQIMATIGCITDLIAK